MNEPRDIDPLEQLVLRIGSLRPAQGERRSAISLFGDRAYLALSPAGRPELFLRGESSSFSGAPLSRALAWGEYRISESDQALPALVVTTPSTQDGRRVMAHLAYETRRILVADRGIQNRDLIQRLDAFFRLAIQNELLTSAEQIGLMGELQLLHELVRELATSYPERATAISSWHGPSASRRDFYNVGTAVEVKTGAAGPRHRVSMDQMLAVDGESLFLCSVQVRRDASAVIKLPDKIEQVAEALGDEELVSVFLEKLSRYGSCGYSTEERHLYFLEPGFFFERSSLYRIDEATPILRRTSFKSDVPPAGVSEICYTLELSSVSPLSTVARDSALSSLVGRSS